ncbi:hypothetical protein D3C84_770990 [compost metagenome]
MGQVAQQMLFQQRLDLRLHLVTLTPVHHAKQVVPPLRQTPGPLIAEVNAGRSPQALADFVDQRIGNIQHQHGVGGKAQRAMVQHQADTAKQPLLAPLAHLLEHLVFVGVYSFGEFLIGARYQRQSAFEVPAQRQRLLGAQSGRHDFSPRAKPRSMR